MITFSLKSKNFEFHNHANFFYRLKKYKQLLTQIRLAEAPNPRIIFASA